MKFENYNFDEEIEKNILSLGFKKPTDIQFKCISNVLQGEDILAVAQTGTGKTIAFALPVIQRLNDKTSLTASKPVRCIVMVPTHELAIQVTDVFNTLAKGTKVKCLGIFGGTDQDPQINTLKKGVDVVVATPGRMFDLESQGHLSLKNIEILILDEADHMLELGFKKDMDHLVRKLSKKRQTLFFSATINKRVKELAYSLVYKAVRIQISPKDPVSKNITHSVAHINMDDKRFFLERIVNENQGKKMLVFVRTKIRAERVKKAMDRVDISSDTIHSDKSQKERNAIMDSFKSGENLMLIATDISARGIDVPSVDIVVNYDLPEEAENYVHRVGRTGRGREKGLAVSFCSEEERGTLNVIETFLQNKITVLEIEKADYEETIDLSTENPHDWKSLIEEAEAFENKIKKKKKKR